MDVMRIIASLNAGLARCEGSASTICSLGSPFKMSVDVGKGYSLTLIERLAARVEYLQQLENAAKDAVVAEKESESRAEDRKHGARCCRETLVDIRREFRRCFKLISEARSGLVSVALHRRSFHRINSGAEFGRKHAYVRFDHTWGPYFSVATRGHAVHGYTGVCHPLFTGAPSSSRTLTAMN